MGRSPKAGNKRKPRSPQQQDKQAKARKMPDDDSMSTGDPPTAEKDRRGSTSSISAAASNIRESTPGEEKPPWFKCAMGWWKKFAATHGNHTIARCGRYVMHLSEKISVLSLRVLRFIGPFYVGSQFQDQHYGKFYTITSTRGMEPGVSRNPCPWRGGEGVEIGQKSLT